MQRECPPELAGHGDLLIVMAYGLVDDGEMATFTPRVAIVDEGNRIVRMS